MAEQRSINIAPGNQILFDSVIHEDGQVSEHFQFVHNATLPVHFVLRDFATQPDVEIGGRVEVQCNKRFPLPNSLTEWVFALTRRIQASDNIVWLDLVFFCNFLSSSSSTLLVLYDLRIAECPSLIIPNGLKLLRSSGGGGAGIALMPLADVPNELHITAKLRFSCFNDRLTCSHLLGPLSASHWEDVVRSNQPTVRRCRLCVRWALRGWKRLSDQAAVNQTVFSPHFGADQVALVFQLCLQGVLTYPKDHLVLQLRILHLPDMCRSRGLRLAANIALQGADEQKIVHRYERENGALSCSFGPRENFAQNNDLRLQALVEFELSKDQYTECAIMLEPFSNNSISSV